MLQGSECPTAAHFMVTAERQLDMKKGNVKMIT
jgi:hypothetical protein